MGVAIDSHECVIRINAAPLKGYERDVGNRTTMRFLSWVTASAFHNTTKLHELFMPNSEPLTMILTTPLEFQKGFNASLKLKSAIVKHMPNSNIALYVSSVKEFERVKAEYLALNPYSPPTLTTGYRALSFARHMCGNITAYGFPSPKWCNKPKNLAKKVQYHYYPTRKFAYECDVYKKTIELNKKYVHNYETEREVFKLWAILSDPIIKFKTPAWND